MKFSLSLLSMLLLGVLVGVGGSWWYTTQKSTGEFVSPFVRQEQTAPRALTQYTIPNLASRSFPPGPALQVREFKERSNEVESYVFTYQSQNKTVSGLLNIPTTPPPAGGYPVIILLRGYVPPENYQSGTGTKNAAVTLAQNGYVTLAPDFLGFGLSDPEPTNSWEARFVKPITVIDLLSSLRAHPTLALDFNQISSVATTTAANPMANRPPVSIALNPQRIGFWAHSNGGQIALTVLEIVSESIPTTLWAPVTAPFPYSVLFFSDEQTDEGKASRAWIAQFEKDYDVFDFSLTKHLNRLKGPLQLHHGTIDEAALKSWSDEFSTKIKTENQNRPIGAEITLNYFTYNGADHNLQPGWNTAIKRDIDFFAKHLKP